ncbi:MAG: hypothetical protein KIT83_17950 [Bryobacterales bacterium]|nr:hypothetical protein [Bryobacterales bacterium]
MSTPSNFPPPGGDFSRQPNPQWNQQPNQQFGQQPLPPAKKSGGMWLWVIGGCLGIVLLGGIAIAALGYFGVKKFQESTGLSAEEFEKRPAFAAAKLLTALNPEIELIDADEDTQRLTIREKATGKTISVTLDELKEGRIRFTDDKGEEFNVRIQGEGDTGSLQVETGDGRQVVNIGPGTAEDLPDWVPVPEGMFTSRQRVSSGDTEIYGGKLTSPLSPEAFAEWFDSAARAKGLNVLNRTVSRSGSGGTVILQAGADGEKRTLSAIGNQNSSGQLEVIYSAIVKP